MVAEVSISTNPEEHGAFILRMRDFERSSSASPSQRRYQTKRDRYRLLYDARSLLGSSLTASALPKQRETSLGHRRDWMLSSNPISKPRLDHMMPY
jgi:hypothetical protein